jgi:hypothetical protein
MRTGICRPSSDCLIQKIERIPRQAVKRILSEQDHSYNDLEYLMRLRDLDLLLLRESETRISETRIMFRFI